VRKYFDGGAKRLLQSRKHEEGASQRYVRKH
jgi:hypothetical protein